MNPYSRFDHEQQLLECWGVVKDLGTILEATESMNLPSAQLDELQNLLIGVQALYDRKFDKLFRMFEQSISEGTQRAG